MIVIRFVQYKQVNFYFIVIDSKENYVIISNLIFKYYLKCKNNDFNVGDIIKVNGRINLIKMHAIESHFDFQKYLNNKGIYYEIIPFSDPLISLTFINRKGLINAFVSNYSDDCKTLIKSIVFGISSSNLNEFKNQDIFLYSKMNNYLLSTIYFFIFYILKKKTKRPIMYTFIFLFPYLLLIGEKVQVFRLIIYVLVFQIIRSKYSLTYTNCLILTLIIYLIISPFNLFNLGLMIPYVLIFAIHFIRRQNITKFSKTFFIYFIIYIIQLLNDGNITLLSPIIRTIMMPLILFYFVFSLISFLFFSHFNFLENLTDFLMKIYHIIEKVECKIYVNDLLILKIIIVILVLFLLYFTYIGHKKNINYTFISIVFLIIVNALPFNNYLYDYVCFIDVGQGDCALIVKNNHALMIDTGGLIYEDLAIETLIPFFKKKHISQIDTVIISHDDFDHSGALDSLCKNFVVLNIVDKKEYFPYTFQGITIHNLNTFEWNNKNDNSLVNYFHFIDKDFLFMGDASKIVEEKIIENYNIKNVDILKLSHHGSNTGSSYNFLKRIMPNVAILSLGFNNIYKFPHQEVISTLSKLNIKYLRTDEEGTIIYKKFAI